MAAFIFTTNLPIRNLTSLRFSNLRSSQHKLSPNFNFCQNPKTTSFSARTSEDQDVLLKESPAISEEESTPAVMSPAEQILRLAMSLAERPVGSAMEVIAPPGSSFSQLSFRFFVTAVAVVAVLPGGGWEWSAVKAVVGAGFLVLSVACFLMSIPFFE